MVSLVVGSITVSNKPMNISLAFFCTAQYQRLLLHCTSNGVVNTCCNDDDNDDDDDDDG